MPVALDDFVRVVEDIAPPGLAYEWDNTGLLLRCAKDINRVLITLDVTSEAVDEAEEMGCDMILSHHPLIFEPIKSLSSLKSTDALLMRLIRRRISLYSAHTSFDRAKGGMGDSLAKRLELKNVEAFDYCGDDLMRTGYLKEPMTRRQLLEHVKTSLDTGWVHASNKCQEPMDKIAVVGGSAGEFLEAAERAGAKALITGEAKHHQFIEANELNVLLITAGHHETERIFIDEVFMSLQSRLNELQLSLEFYKAKSTRAPFECI